MTCRRWLHSWASMHSSHSRAPSRSPASRQRYAFNELQPEQMDHHCVSLSFNAEKLGLLGVCERWFSCLPMWRSLGDCAAVSLEPRCIGKNMHSGAVGTVQSGHKAMDNPPFRVLEEETEDVLEGREQQVGMEEASDRREESIDKDVHKGVNDGLEQLAFCQANSAEFQEAEENGDAGIERDFSKRDFFPTGANSEDAPIAQSLCQTLETGGWRDDTEAFLQEHYAKHLSRSFVSRVVLQQQTVPVALRFFHWANKQIELDISSYHALLFRLGKDKLFTEMWELLHDLKARGLQANSTSFLIILKSYGQAHCLGEAVKTFVRMREFNVVPNAPLYATLLIDLFVSKLVREARLVYSIMLKEGLELDTFAWSTLTRGFGKLGYANDAEFCFNRMFKEGCNPSLSAYTGLIEGFCNCLALNKALKALSTLQEVGLKPNVHTFNPLLAALCKAGRYVEASNIVANMRTVCSPNQATYNILLQGLLAKKDFVKAFEFVEMMDDEGWTDGRSYSYLLTAVKDANETDRLLPSLQRLFAKHGYGNADVCNILLSVLASSSSLAETETFFNDMTKRMNKPSLPAYATMISLYCNSERIDKAISLLSDLKARGLQPSVFCYTPILAAVLKLNRVVEGFNLFKEMLAFRLDTNAITCDFLLRKVSQEGMLENTMMLCDHVMKKKLVINNVTLFSVMKCLCKRDKVEESNAIFQSMHRQGCLMDTRAIIQSKLVMDKMSHSIDRRV